MQTERHRARLPFQAESRPAGPALWGGDLLRSTRPLNIQAETLARTRPGKQDIGTEKAAHQPRASTGFE